MEEATTVETRKHKVPIKDKKPRSNWILYLSIGVVIILIALFGFKTITGGAIIDVRQPLAVNSEVAPTDSEQTEASKVPTVSAQEQAVTSRIESDIKDVFELRTSSKGRDVLKTAQLITKLKSSPLVISAQTQNSWQNVLKCVYEDCSSKVYLDLIDSISLNQPNQKTVFIHSLIETHNFWDGRNTLQFSESLTRTDQFVKEIGDEGVSAKWGKVIACNGKCSTFSEDVLDVIEEVVS